MSSDTIDKKIREAVMPRLGEDGRSATEQAAREALNVMTMAETMIVAYEGTRVRAGSKYAALVREMKVKAREAGGGQLSFISDIDPVLIVDEQIGAKATASMTRGEFMAALDHQRQKSAFQVEKTRRLEEAATVLSPIWDAHPDWTVQQCEVEIGKTIAGDN